MSAAPGSDKPDSFNHISLPPPLFLLVPLFFSFVNCSFARSFGSLSPQLSFCPSVHISCHVYLQFSYNHLVFLSPKCWIVPFRLLNWICRKVWLGNRVLCVCVEWAAVWMGAVMPAEIRLCCWLALSAAAAILLSARQDFLLSRVIW